MTDRELVTLLTQLVAAWDADDFDAFEAAVGRARVVIALAAQREDPAGPTISGVEP